MIASLLLIPAVAAPLLSAAALYLASPHCRWTISPSTRRAGNPLGQLLAIIGLMLWINQMGAAAGFCTTLLLWMLGLIAMPWLGLLSTPIRATEKS